MVSSTRDASESPSELCSKNPSSSLSDARPAPPTLTAAPVSAAMSLSASDSRAAAADRRAEAASEGSQPWKPARHEGNRSVAI